MTVFGRVAIAQRAPAPWATLLLGLAVAVFLAAPLAYLAMQSFETFVQPGVFSSDATLANYERAIIDPYAATVLLTSLRIAAVVTIGCVVLGLPVAMFVAREMGWRQRLVLIVIAASLFTNLVVRAYGWMVFLAPKGPLNALLMGGGLVDKPLRLLSTEAGVEIALVQELLPVFILLSASALQNVERTLEEAAFICGASWLRVFRRVILPIGLPGIAAGTTLVFLMAFGSFVAPEFIGGGRVLTVGTLIRQLVAKVINYPFASALSILLILLALAALGLIAGATQRLSRRSTR
jgi:putative spermidine/putrescine transport system permease protein